MKVSLLFISQLLPKKNLEIIKSIPKNNDSIVHSLQKKIYILENKNELLTTAIDVNNNIFGGLSTYFTVISILLSIIVIAIPVINYFLVLKPNRAVLSKLSKLENDFPKKLEADFGMYMSGFEKRKAKQLIETLNDKPNLSEIFNFFFISSFSDFDDYDIKTVVKFLQDQHDIDNMYRSVLNSILKSKPSATAESFYKNILESGSKDDYSHALEYLIDNDLKRNIKFFELLFKGSQKPHELLFDIFDHIYNRYLGSPFNKSTAEKKLQGEEKACLFLNNEDISTLALSQEIPKLVSDKININVVNWHPFIKETYYHKKKIENKDSH